MSDFLFHKVSEKEKEDIKREAKKLMDDFSEKLSVIEDKKLKYSDEVQEFEREEGDKVNGEEFSREIMFENAPKKNKDFIIAEKGGW